MRVFVTGGAGYIGSHACKALARAGYEPITFDNLSTGHRAAVRWGPLCVGDVRNAQQLAKAFAIYRPQVVVHLAALAYVGESMDRPAEYYAVNTFGTLQVLEAMRSHDVSKLVFSSTCATYGRPDILPVTEETPQRPINPYGFTKLAAERMISDFSSAYGLRSVTLRYFNAAGADPDGEIGEDHDPETHVIPLAIQSALDLRGAFEIFGADYPTRDGSAIRDYAHVSDLAQAHVLAVAHLADGQGGGAFNLGTGVGVSVFEVLQAVGRVTGRPPPTVIAPRRPGDSAELYAAAERANLVLGWSPQYADVDTIVETAVRWIQGPSPAMSLRPSQAVAGALSQAPFSS